MKLSKFRPRKFIISANIEYFDQVPFDTTDYEFTCELVTLNGKLPDDELSLYFLKKDVNFSKTEHEIILMYIYEFGLYNEVLCDDLALYDIKLGLFDEIEDAEILTGLKDYFGD